MRDEAGLNTITIYQRKGRLFARGLDHIPGIDPVPHAGLSVGNIRTHANAGAPLRLGSNLPSVSGRQLLRPGGGNSPIDDREPRVAPDRLWSFFLFGAADGLAVARGFFLAGTLFRDSRARRRQTTWQSPATARVSSPDAGSSPLPKPSAPPGGFVHQPFEHNDFGSVTTSYAF